MHAVRLHPLPWPILALLTSCATRAEPLARFEYQHRQMGTLFKIVLYAPDEAAAEKAAGAAFTRIDLLNDIMSDYAEGSELTRLSRSGGSGAAVPLSDDLWTVLDHAQRLALASDGAFDITIGPLAQLWRWARRTKEMPPPDLLAEARQCVGHAKLVLDPDARTARLLAPHMRLDLGAIAKGYAGDQALKELAACGVTRALVDAGGDIVVGEPPPDRPGWRVAIAPLDAPDAPPSRYLIATRAAIATSGDAWQFVEIDGRRYSHLVDPKTGLGLTDHSSVTVVVLDTPGCGMIADGLASAVSVLGPEQGLALVDQTPRAAALIVRRPEAQLETHQSARFAELNIVSREQLERAQP